MLLPVRNKNNNASKSIIHNHRTHTDPPVLAVRTAKTIMNC